MRIIIIGGVATGMSAAAKAIRLKKDVEIVIYEEKDTVSWGACGLPYYVGDFFQDPTTLIAKPIEKLQESGLDIKIRHKVTAVDFKSKKIEVINLTTEEHFEDSYDKLLIATGAKAIKPSVDGIDLKGVYFLKEYDDGLKLKERLLDKDIQKITIIGAGYIGLEIMEAVKHLNKKEIRIIQLGERVLQESFDSEITDIIHRRILEEKNIFLHLNEKLEKILNRDGKVIGIKTTKGEYESDIVIVATGIKPNTEFLKDSDLKIKENGAIEINDRGETNIKNVYSAGDCAIVYHKLKGDTYIPLATTANKLGRIIGENLVGGDKVFKGTLGSAAVKVLDLEVGRTGLSENEVKKLGIEYGIVFVKDKNQTNYYPGQEDIYIKLIYDKKKRNLLGGQIVGKKGAVLRVNTLAVAIYSNLTVEELGMMDFCYTPPFSRTWDIINVAGNIAK